MSLGCKRSEAVLFNRTGAPFVIHHLPHLHFFFSLVRNSKKESPSIKRKKTKAQAATAINLQCP
jgi:hypothetical protein